MIFFISTTLFSLTRPLSGLNTKDFLNIDKLGVEWKDNPFIHPQDNAGVDEMTLFAVVFSKKKSAALINDQIVKIGDKIGSSEVVDIQKQTVILRNESGIHSLSFKRNKNEKP
jgi:hypothetical protein